MGVIITHVDIGLKNNYDAFYMTKSPQSKVSVYFQGYEDGTENRKYVINHGGEKAEVVIPKRDWRWRDMTLSNQKQDKPIGFRSLRSRRED